MNKILNVTQLQKEVKEKLNFHCTVEVFDQSFVRFPTNMIGLRNECITIHLANLIYDTLTVNQEVLDNVKELESLMISVCEQLGYHFEEFDLLLIEDLNNPYRIYVSGDDGELSKDFKSVNDVIEFLTNFKLD